MPNTSKLIIKHYNGFGGNFVSSQYLGAAYETGKPYVFENTLTKIFSSRSYIFTGKALLNMTGANVGGSKEIDAEVFRWRLSGAEMKFARSVENLEANNPAPGLNNTTFKIKLDLDYYQSPDVLFGMDPELPLAIVEGPVQDGTGYIYTVRIEGDSPSAFYPVQYLEPGKQFNKVWTTIQSEFNKEYGTQQYPGSFMLESQVSFFGQKQTVTDKAWRDSGRLGIDFLYTDANGNEKRESRFLPMAEAKMHDELYQSIEAKMWYGKKETRPGNDGFWKKSGPGVREQLKDSWIEYYSSALTTNRIQDYLMSIFFTRKDEGSRDVTATTGSLGKFMFHKMLAGEAKSFLTMDTHFISGTSNSSSTPGLAYGAEFVNYRGPLGVNVKLMQNPLYDSTIYCKRMHPAFNDMPIDSARMTFLDFANVGGQQNIQMLKVKDTYSWGYVAGTHTPTGPVKGGQAGALIDGYDMFTKGSAGIVIFDVSRCGELVFDLAD